MDNYETLNVRGFDYLSTQKYGALANLESDPCNIKLDNSQSQKPMKYYTQNFFDKEVVQNRGINFHDGFGTPSCKIDQNTKTRFGTPTNLNVLQNLPALPLPTTASYVKGQGPVLVEQRIRPEIARTDKTCQPREVDFYKRHFSIFDHLPVAPNECVDNVVQKGSAFRQGIDTRKCMSDLSS